MTQPYARMNRAEVEQLLRSADVDPSQYSDYSLPALKGLVEGMSLGRVQAEVAQQPVSVFPADCTTDGQKFRWAFQQNARAVGEGLGLIRT